MTNPVTRSIIVPIFGTPSPFTYWLIEAIYIFCNKTIGPTLILSGNSLNELREKWASRGDKSVIFHADTPDQDIVQLFSNVPGKIIVATEPLETVANYAQIYRGLTPQAALSFASRSFSTIFSLRSHPHLIELNNFMMGLSFKEFSQRFIFPLFFETDQASNSDVTRFLNGVLLEDMTVAWHVDEWMRRQSQKETNEKRQRALPDDLAAIAKNYDAILLDGSKMVLDWSPSVFRLMQDLSYVDGPIDLKGPARVLIGGHSLSLPTGSWKLKADFSVWENLSGNMLYADIYAEDKISASSTMQLPANGRIDFELQFKCEDPFYPLIFRMAIMEGAIEGFLDLHGVRFERVD